MKSYAEFKIGDLFKINDEGSNDDGQIVILTKVLSGYTGYFEALNVRFNSFDNYFYDELEPL